jgi:hypothetical protein
MVKLKIGFGKIKKLANKLATGNTVCRKKIIGMAAEIIHITVPARYNEGLRTEITKAEDIKTKAAERYNESCGARSTRPKLPLERKMKPQNAYVCQTLPHERTPTTTTTNSASGEREE